MSSSVQANANAVIDLVSSPSSPSPLSPGRRTQRSMRRLRRQRRHESTSNNDNNNHNDNNNARTEPEVIDLEDDAPSPPRAHFGIAAAGRGRLSPGKRRRPHRATALTVDDDIVEIISPPRAAVAAAASLKRAASSPTMGGSAVHRIREVFPLVGRARVESLLAMAKSYSGEDDADGAFYTVMSVLSEDPSGESVSEATFAAAAVRDAGRHGAKGSSTKATARKGRRKVAQLECQCCFVEYDYEEMVSCRTGGHLFCKTCLQKHTEQRVFGVGNLGVKHDGSNAKHAAKAIEILCMAGECPSGFHEAQLRKALSEKVLKKYNELQYAAVVESANIKDIAKCPKCHFLAVADPALPPPLFHCPQCNFKSCRECGEEYHRGIRCDEVESKTEADGRTKVEEAMTKAMVRTCPRPMCRKKMLKDGGCNKMTCACGAFLCYVCRKEIPASIAYKHFCQTPHCHHQSCNKCPLYADTTEADKVRVRNAAKKTARSVRKKVHVDVDAMLKDPP